MGRFSLPSGKGEVGLFLFKMSVKAPHRTYSEKVVQHFEFIDGWVNEQYSNVRLYKQ